MPLPLVTIGIWTLAVPIAIKILLGLGLGFGIYTGLDAGINEIESILADQYLLMPANMLAIVKMAGFTTGISMTIASYAAATGIGALKGAFLTAKGPV